MELKKPCSDAKKRRITKATKTKKEKHKVRRTPITEADGEKPKTYSKNAAKPSDPKKKKKHVCTKCDQKVCDRD